MSVAPLTHILDTLVSITMDHSPQSVYLPGYFLLGETILESRLSDSPSDTSHLATALFHRLFLT